jgi:signal transduction histidine kinase
MSFPKLASVERRATLLQAAVRVAKNVTSILDPDSLLQQTVDIICDEFGFYYAGVFLIDQTGEWAVLRAGRGAAGAAMVIEEHKLAVGGNSMIGAATGSRQARIALDVGEEAVFFKNPYLPRTRSEMALPLVVGNEVMGALTVQSVEEAAFTQEDIATLQLMADQLAVAIKNSRLHRSNQALLRQAERRVRLFQASNQVGREVAQILDLNKLLPKTVDIICDAYGFYYAGVFLIDETGEWAVLRAGRGRPGQDMIAAGHKLEVGGLSMIGTAISQRQARIALDVGAEAVFFKNPYLPHTRSEMALPLVAGDRAVGAVTVQSIEERAFSSDDITALQTMADHLAVAIHNAQLLVELKGANTELLRTRTFEAIATATAEAIHWVGNKAAPISGSAHRVREDLGQLLAAFQTLLLSTPIEQRESHPLWPMAEAAFDVAAQHGVNLEELAAELTTLDAEWLKFEVGLESIIEDLEIIEQSANTILNIKEDLIGPAREQSIARLDLPNLLQDTVAGMGLPSGVVRLDLDPHLALARGDPRQVQRVFVNLVKNAWEALHGHQQPHITVVAQPASDPGFVMVQVQDNGPGIPPEVLDKIWVSFFTTKAERGGTGLGLSACMKIINQSEGKIWVDSRVGEGTTFTVLLPVAD